MLIWTTNLTAVAFPKATWPAFGNPSQSHIGLCQSHFLAKDMKAFHRSQPFPKGWGVPPTRHSFSKLCASPSSGMDLVRNRCTKMRYFGATLRESLVEDTPIETDDVSRLICPTKSSALKHHWALGFKCLEPQTMWIKLWCFGTIWKLILSFSKDHFVQPIIFPQKPTC